MDLIKAVTRRHFLNEALYVILNIGLAVAVLVLVKAFQPPYLAALLVLLSKWRVFAVRPRFWFAHIQSNLVDVLVGIGFVGLLYRSDESLLMQLVLTGLYITWLLVLKPRTKRKFVVWQAGIANFVALMALSMFSANIPSSLFVLGVWVIGYASAKHALTAYDEEQTSLISLAYGFIFAQLGWFYYHWMVAYPTFANIDIPQFAITGLLISFTAHALYAIFHKKGRITGKDVKMPLALLLGVLAVILAFFTPWSYIL